MTLFAAMLALFGGPLLEALGRIGERTLAFVEGFVFVTVAGLILLGLLPEAVATLGPAGLALAGAGFLLLFALEAGFARAARSTHAAVLLLGVLALMLHQAMDGMALGSDLRYRGNALPGPNGLHLAVILHSLPLGIAVWFLSVPAVGRSGALALLAVLAGATGTGYLVGPRILGLLDSRVLAGVQALLAGSVLHIVAHGGTGLRQARQRRGESGHAAAAPVGPAERLGTLAGLALLAVWW